MRPEERMMSTEQNRDRHCNLEAALTRNSSYDHRHPGFSILSILAQIPLHLIHARQVDQLDPVPALSLGSELFYRHPDLFSVPVGEEDGVHPQRIKGVDG
jgi:hypothetical protein